MEKSGYGGEMRNDDNWWLITIIVIFVFILSVIGHVRADIDIYCPACKKPIYIYTEDTIPKAIAPSPGDFKPANSKIKQPGVHSKMECPYCDAPFNGYEYLVWKESGNRPKLIYPAYTFLTKDDGGVFKYVPWDLDTD